MHLLSVVVAGWVEVSDVTCHSYRSFLVMGIPIPVQYTTRDEFRQAHFTAGTTVQKDVLRILARLY
jgi:hypothetical protein